MSQDNLDVVARIYEAWNRRDPHCEAFYSVDAEFRDLQRAPDAPPVIRGIKAVKQTWLSWLLLVGDVHTEIEDYAELDDWVICITHWSGSRAPSNAPIDLRSVEAFQVRDGKIRQTVLGYESREQALVALGGLGVRPHQPTTRPVHASRPARTRHRTSSPRE